jgi:predicted GNAT family acetyltransferase
LIARDEKDGKVLGFVSFRFTRAGEAVYQPIGPACVHMLDFVVSQRFRKNGLGKYMMAITMMIAKKADLPCVTIPVFSEEWKAFLDKTVKGEEWTQAHDDELGGGGSVRVEVRIGEAMTA